MTERQSPKIDVGDGAAIPRREDRGLVSAWWIALTGAVALLVLLPLLKPDPYLDILRFIPDGILITFQVTICSIVLAIIIGLLTGLGRISRNRFINLIASFYVEVVRGIPLLVQLFYIYFALGRLVKMPDIAAAILKPFVSAENHWMVEKHGIFQGYYFFHHLGMDRHLREQFKDHPQYQATIEFCAKYDAAAFDPDYESLPLSFFEPMLQRVFARPKNSIYLAAMDNTSA